MAKAFSTLRSSLLRPLLHQRNQFLLRAILTPTISQLSQTTHSITPPLPSPPPPTTLSSLLRPLSNLVSSFSSSPLRSRNFCSDSSDIPPNIALIKSGEELDDVYRKAQDESQPVIFYFTAEWCGPCRFLWPDMRKLSEEFAHVRFCKINIDLEDVGDFLARLNISSVPTLLFFSNGKKAAEVVGADSKRIRNITSELYRKD